MYVDDVMHGTCDGNVEPKILKETPCTAWVDGRNGLGAVIGNYCMELAMKKAKEVGVGWVCAKGTKYIRFDNNYCTHCVKLRKKNCFENTTTLFQTYKLRCGANNSVGK